VPMLNIAPAKIPMNKPSGRFTIKIHPGGRMRYVS
jgi:hypothetical protein